MRRFNIFQPFWMSFYSKPLYRDVGQKWSGVGFLYLLLLLALCWIPMMFMMDRAVDNFVYGYANHVAKNIPEITVTNGIVTIDKEVPYFIKDNKGNIFAVVDTTGDYTSLMHSPAQIILTKSKFFMKEGDGKIKEVQIPPTANFTLGQTQVQQGLGFIGRWSAYITYPIMVLASFIYRIIQVLIYAAIGALILMRVMKVKLDYQQLVRLSVIAVTPAVIISTILSLLGISFPFEWLLYFVLAMAYIMFGIGANRTESELPKVEASQK